MTEWFLLLAPMAGFAMATSATPGPVVIVSAMTGARFGLLRSFGYALGATVSFVAILVLTGLGLGTVIVDNPAVAKALAVVGAVYILYLAYKVARIKEIGLGDTEAEDSATPPGFISGMVAQAANPKAWVSAVSAVSVYVATAPDYDRALTAFSGVYFVVCLLCLWGWAAVGRWISALSGNVILFTRIMAALLALSVIAFLVSVLIG